MLLGCMTVKRTVTMFRVMKEFVIDCLFAKVGKVSKELRPKKTFVKVIIESFNKPIAPRFADGNKNRLNV